MQKTFVRSSMTTAMGVAAVALAAAGALAATGPSSSQTPYLVGTQPGVGFVSILTAGDTPGTPAAPTSAYKMAGTPDGLGWLDNGDGTFNVFLAHEFSASAGVARSHGNTTGAFVSQWQIDKATLKVLDGKDLITSITNGSTNVALAGSALNINRFCSADLPAANAFFNPASGNGTTARLFLNGEETAGGRAFASVVTGPNIGKSYTLPALGGYAWENLLANPSTGEKTLVIGTDDSSGIGQGLLPVYLGTKTNIGTDVEKAGLTNGTLGFLKVGSLINEDRTTAVGAAKNVPTAFTVDANPANATGFLRPEDGAWDPSNPNDFYFVTTDRYDQVKDGAGAQVGRTRLWKAQFTDLANPLAGGNITMLLDGTEQGNMYDNMTIDGHGHVLLQEDVGNQFHNGKILAYDIASGLLTVVAKHDVSRFGDLGIASTAPFSRDEEASGIIDAEALLGRGWFLLDDQAHYPLGSGAPLSYEVEGGQLLALYIPDSAFTPEPGALSLLALAAVPALRRRKR